MNNKVEELIEKSLTFDYVVGNKFLGKCFSEKNKRYTATLVSSVLKGKIKFSVDHHNFINSAGNTIIVPPGKLHHSDTLGQVIDVVYAHVNYRILGTIDLLSLFKLPLRIDGEQSNNISSILHELLIVNQDSSPWQRITKLKVAGFKLLENLLLLAEEEPDSQDILNRHLRLRPVLEILERDYANHSLSLGQMAKSINLSTSRFQHMFKSIMKQSPAAYLKQIRIRHAQVLLLKTDLPIQEIALKVGYNDPFHFSRTFKDYCGESPSIFRSN